MAVACVKGAHRAQPRVVVPAQTTDKGDEMRLHWRFCPVAVSFTVIVALSSAALAEATIKNGLSSESFRRNALTTNKKSLESLLQHPLTRTQDGDLFADDSYVVLQLHDPRAQAVMEE